MSLEQFCYSTSERVMRGLAQAVKIQPYRHYQPAGYNAARVLTLKLGGINPRYLQPIQGLRDQLAMWARLPENSEIRIIQDGGYIVLEIPKPPQYWQKVTIEQLDQRRAIRRGPVATLGLGVKDQPQRINFQEAAMAHVFIVGQTRSGKTNTQKLIAWNIARNTSAEQGQLLIFDVAKRGYAWREFARCSHLAHPIITELAEAEAVLQWLVEEMGRRATGHYTTPRIFVNIDELKALIEDSEIAGQCLNRLASVGGEFGIHLILSTQYPQIKMLGSAEIKRNVTTRLCGKVDDGLAAANALGLKGTGAESLQGYGDFLLKDFDGLARLTVAKVETHHIDNLTRAEPKRLILDHIQPGVALAPAGSHKPAPKPPSAEEIGITLAHWREYVLGIVKIKKLIRHHCGYYVSDDRARRIQEHVGQIIEYSQKFTDPGCLDQKGLVPYNAAITNKEEK